MEARTLFEFVGQNSQELSFRRNMEILITDTTDPSWYKAEARSAANSAVISEGFVPSNHLEVLPCEWFHGKITRAKAEEELRTRGRQGTFLVRESESQPGSFSLSVKQGNAVQHYKIMRNPQGLFYVWEEAFPSINRLVAHYGQVSVARDGPALTLSTALSKSRGAHSSAPAPQPIAQQQMAPQPIAQQQMAQQPMAQPRPVAMPVARPVIQVMVGMFDFHPLEEGELEFKKGDRIEVIDKPEEQWWLGRCCGREGLFPKVYCREE